MAISKALELIFRTSPIEVEMMALLSDVLNTRLKAESTKEKETDALSTCEKPLPQVWDFVYKNSKKIVLRSIAKDSGAKPYLKNRWLPQKADSAEIGGEGESALFEVVAKYGKSFNMAFANSGTSGVEALAVTSLKNEFLAYCKTEETGGIIKGVIKNETLIGEKEYKKMTSAQRSLSVGEKIKSFTTVSIHDGDDDENSSSIEIQSDELDPLEMLLRLEAAKERDQQTAYDFEEISKFVKSNSMRYPVLFDFFEFKTGLMTSYCAVDVKREFYLLANHFGIEINASELSKAIERFKVLNGSLKINTVQNKLGIINQDLIIQAIKSRMLSFDDVSNARQKAFRSHAEINGLLNGFYAGDFNVVFSSFDDLVNAAIMSVVEGRSQSHEFNVIADLLCVDPTKLFDEGFQKAKRELMSQIFGENLSSTEHESLAVMPVPPAHFGDQISLF
jgi:hypothetical protein